MKKTKVIVCLCTLLLLYVAQSFAQDKRGQLNSFLRNGYINGNCGYIHYPYGNGNLNAGYRAKQITIPHFGGRILLGFNFTKNFALQYSVMRAVIWPYYQFQNPDGTIQKKNVWVNEWGLSLKYEAFFTPKSSFFLEGGVGLLARNGFEANTGAIVEDANYATFLGGAGLQYQLGKRWDVILSGTWSPPNKANNQPYTLLASAGVVFHLRKLSDSVYNRNANTPYLFPKQIVQFGAASNVLGFTANNLFSVSTEFKGLPIFWRGIVQTQIGFAVNYQKNVFHSRKRFSIDWGVSASFWQTEKNKDKFFTLSVFPVLRYWFLRQKPLDMYFVYSIVGPTYISKVDLDSRDTGKHFTYQDFMGIGSFFGKNRKLNAEIKIEHYSNGNIFATNPGVDIPLMLNLGYAF